MGLKIYWTDFAKDQLKDIFDYYHKKVSLKLARKITNNIVSKAKKLNDFPGLRKIKENLEERPQNFSYFIVTNFKLIYWINIENKRIDIVDFFDTRQNPKKILKNK